MGQGWRVYIEILVLSEDARTKFQSLLFMLLNGFCSPNKNLCI